MSFTDLERKYPVVWAMNNIVLPKGKWDFVGRAWQIDIFNDPATSLVVRKPAQVGMTTIVLARVLHWAVFNRGNVMYTLPRQTDVTDLVNARFREIVVNSPTIAGLVGDVDNVRMKRIGDSFIQFAEASVEPRMMDVDFLVNDEYDLSNQENLQLLTARLFASQHQIHYRFSTPTVPGFGISSLFDVSDQKYWFVKCPRCNKQIILDWDKHVRIVDDDVWYACDKCDRKIDGDVITDGQWVAKYPGRSISGYQVSQMICPYIPPGRVYEQRLSMDDRAFYNLCLGMPYESKSAGFSRSLILNRCFVTRHDPERSGRGYFLGADQGETIHVAVGKYEDGRIKVVHLEKITGSDAFEQLSRLAKRYGVSLGLVDALPNRYSARKLYSETKGKVVPAMFRDDTPLFRGNPYNWKSEDLILLSKHECYDVLLDRITAGDLQFYGSSADLNDEVADAIDSLSDMRRYVEVSGGRSGVTERVYWRSVGRNDHYADALVYLVMSVIIGGKRKGLSVINLFERGGDEGEEDEWIPQNPHVAKRRAGPMAAWRRIMERRKADAH